MKVIYSIGSKFGGHGIGAQAAQAVRGIYRARALKKVLASYSGSSKLKSQNSNLHLKSQNLHGVPRRYIKTMGVVGKGLRRLAYYDPTGYGYVLHDNIFDRWAASQLEPCDIFHGWNHHCLYQIREIRKGIKGVKGVRKETMIVVERASSHILQGQEILREEYRKYGVRGPFLTEAYIKKCLQEYEEADYILVPSEYSRQSFLERGFDESRIVEIPFGVDSGKFKTQNSNLKKRFARSLREGTSQSLKLSNFIVLFVGEIRLGKGVQYLLEAWDKLKLKDAELWLVGEVKRDFKGIKGIKGLKGVRFLGFRTDIPELMTQASVFVFPSLDEGSALVTYEAMAAGLPVITTPNAGSLVRDSIDGYLIPIRNSEVLAERIEFFYHYPHQAVEMGRNGQERVGEFTWEKYGENLVKAYIKMLK